MKVLIEPISSIHDEELKSKPYYVTAERWEKVLRIRPLEDKKRSLLAGKLLYQMCKEYGIENPVYGAIENGKPMLISHPQIAFNLSHSGEFVVLAYTEKAETIGVDIQQIRSVSDGVKKRILHEKEFLLLDREKEMENIFLNRIWAIKESYVKMTGEGLSHDFRKLCIDFESRTVKDENGRIACYEELKVPDGYVAAVTIKE